MEVNMNNYYLGGDVSKGYCDFVILDKNKEVIEPDFQLDDTFEGHNQLHQVFSNFFSAHPDSILYAATESTGSYENNWLNCMLKFSLSFPIKVARLNPLGVNRNSQADMKRNKTDKISAKDVAEYLIAHPKKVNPIEEKPEETLREHFNYIEMLKKQKTQLLNLLEIDVYKANPELLLYCKQGFPQWVLTVLQQYPTAKHLAAASSVSLLKLAYISPDKAVKIICQAKSSVASNVDPITADRISELASDILKKEQQIKNQKGKLAKNKKILPKDVDILQSFIGIGIYSAVGLLIHIDAVERFANSKNIASFFGLHPVYRKSGDGVWGTHMSKQGDVAVRNILYMVTLSAIVHNPHIRKIYKRHLKHGKKKLSAIGVCMHKILRIVYGMIKNQTKFNADVDRRNQDKQHSIVQIAIQNKDRRYQNYDTNAPISSRQTKKRNQQNVNIVQVKNLKTYRFDLSHFDLN